MLLSKLMQKILCQSSPIYPETGIFDVVVNAYATNTDVGITGNDSCWVGFAPTGEKCLSTAHELFGLEMFTHF